MFKDGRPNVHDEERSGRSAIRSESRSFSKCLPKKEKILKGGISQCHNFRVNFHKFHALFCMRLSEIGYAITSLRNMEKPCRLVDSKVEWGLLCSKIFVTYQQH
jgi:hypothetical protein